MNTSPMSFNITRYQELRKLSKQDLAQLHHDRGGLLSVREYARWGKEELIHAVMEDESYSAH